MNAQTGVVGNEQYDSYVQCVYIDNLLQSLIPDVFVHEYHNGIDPSDLKTSVCVYTGLRERNIHVTTNKAEDGYLFVNDSVMKKINNLNCDINRLKIIYTHNNEDVEEKNDVVQVVRLRKKRIKQLDILYEKESDVVRVIVDSR